MSNGNSKKESQIWNRVGYVEIYIWQGKGKPKIYNFEGHDFRFRVSHILGRMPEGNATISICNVKQDTANDIITLCCIPDALATRKTIKIYAGYEDPENKNYKGDLLAIMDIVNATISSPPPDIWLEITAVYAAWLNDIAFTIDILKPIGDTTYNRKVELKGIEWISPLVIGKLLKDHFGGGVLRGPTNAENLQIVEVTDTICKKLTELYKKTFPDSPIEFIADCSYLEPNDVGNVETPGKTYNFHFEGTLAQIPTKIAESFKVVADWEERNDGKIYLSCFPDPEYPMKHVTGKAWRDRVKKGRKIKFLDVEHGLIGIPKLKDAINLQCRCFLDGSLQCGDYVSVRSEMIPAIYEVGEDIRPSNSSLGYVWGKGSRRIDSATVKGFQIMKITFSGHFRGNSWFCDIEARTPYKVEKREDTLQVQKISLTEDISSKMKKEGWECLRRRVS